MTIHFMDPIKCDRIRDHLVLNVIFLPFFKLFPFLVTWLVDCYTLCMRATPAGVLYKKVVWMNIDNSHGVPSIAFLVGWSQSLDIRDHFILGLPSQKIHYLGKLIWSIYGNIECWAMLCTYKMLRFLKNYELRHRWFVYNFLAITRLRKLFKAWLFDRWTLE